LDPEKFKNIAVKNIAEEALEVISSCIRK